MSEQAIDRLANAYGEKFGPRCRVGAFVAESDHRLGIGRIVELDLQAEQARVFFYHGGHFRTLSLSNLDFEPVNVGPPQPE